MMRRILIGYDGSEDAKHAFDFAVGLARTFSAELHVLAVIQPPDFDGDVETETVIDDERRNMEKMLRELQAKLAHEPLKTQVGTAIGHASDQIVLRAEEIDADHIVVGHRGRSPVGRWLIGSVARHVIDKAPCAVTVTKLQR